MHGLLFLCFYMCLRWGCSQASTYLSTLSRNPKAEHIWSYLRLTLASMGRDDLIPAAHDKNLDAFRGQFDF
jgi:hypothetical protein